MGVVDMTNRSKQKGTSAEVAVRDYLRANGYPQAERLPTEGKLDRGDIAGFPVTVEVKAHKTYDIPQWLREAETEAANAGNNVGVVWFKLRGTTDPGRWCVAMTGESFLRLVHQIAASAAWDTEPKTAMVEYGLPCWHGHYGGCSTCEGDAA